MFVLDTGARVICTDKKKRKGESNPAALEIGKTYRVTAVHTDATPDPLVEVDGVLGQFSVEHFTFEYVSH